MSKLPNPSDFKNFKATLKPSQYSSTSSKSTPLELVAKEFNSFEPLTEAYNEPLKALFPEWLYNESNEADIAYFSFLVRFDKKLNSLVAAVVENEILGVRIVSYKHRMRKSIKWFSRAGTHPNNTVLHRVYADDEPIYVVEGIRDFLAGVLLGLNIIGIPTASYKGSVSVAKNDDVIFLVEDDAALPVMKRLAQEANRIAKSVRLRRYVGGDSKMDLSDMCFNCSSIKEVKDAL